MAVIFWNKKGGAEEGRKEERGRGGDETEMRLYCEQQEENTNVREAGYQGRSAEEL